MCCPNKSDLWRTIAQFLLHHCKTSPCLSYLHEPPRHQLFCVYPLQVYSGKKKKSSWSIFIFRLSLRVSSSDHLVGGNDNAWKYENFGWNVKRAEIFTIKNSQRGRKDKFGSYQKHRPIRFFFWILENFRFFPRPTQIFLSDTRTC